MRASVLRAAAWIAAGAACIAGAVVAGAGHGYSLDAPRMLSGAAWLPSSRARELGLLDGSTVRVAAQVYTPVTSVFQLGQDAYAVDTGTGTVHFVDGATMQAGPGVHPIPGSARGLRVFATREVVYAVDTVSHRVALAEPVSMAPRGTPWTVWAAQDGADIGLDRSGRLWVFDPRAGSLSMVTGSGVTNYPAMATRGAGAMVVAGGRPVVMDAATSVAATINPTTDRVRLGLRARAGRLTIGGSPDSDRLYSASDGEVSVCELVDNGCGAPITLSGAGPQLGTPVEAGGRLFVPDPSTGTVFVVDPAGREVVARPVVLARPGRFDLIARDGLVFFNDPMTARAGVIRPDGEVIVTEKYEKYHPPKARPAKRESPSPSPSPSPSTVSPVRSPPAAAPGTSSEPGPGQILTVRPPVAGRIAGRTGIDCGKVCVATFAKGLAVTLTATSVAGYELDHWTGGSCSGRASVCRVRMDKPRTVGAVFRMVSVDLMTLLSRATWRDESGPRSFDPRDPRHSVAEVVTISGIRGYEGQSLDVLVPDPATPWIEADFFLPLPLVKGNQLTVNTVCPVDYVKMPPGQKRRNCDFPHLSFEAFRPDGRYDQGRRVKSYPRGISAAELGGPDYGPITYWPISGNDGSTAIRIRITKSRLKDLAPGAISFMSFGHQQ